MKRFRIVQDIYEGDELEPTLTHVFYGETRERAREVYQAHMGTDAFMRACVTRRQFRDFSCHALSRMERLAEHNNGGAGVWILDAG